MPLSRKMKAKINMIDLGILPAFTGKELTEMLDSLPPDEKRQVKRKFRKIWRKMLKDKPEIREMIVSETGVPLKHHLRNRSCLVITSIIRNMND
jgi:hypothetical protein